MYPSRGGKCTGKRKWIQILTGMMGDAIARKFLNRYFDDLYNWLGNRQRASLGRKEDVHIHIYFRREGNNSKDGHFSRCLSHHLWHLPISALYKWRPGAWRSNVYSSSYDKEENFKGGVLPIGLSEEGCAAFAAYRMGVRRCSAEGFVDLIWKDPILKM